MDTPRPRLDLLAFGLALGLIAWAAIGFIRGANGAAAIMCVMCFGGLVGGRAAGVPGRVLLPVALGLVAALWMIWIDHPGDPDTTSALAHVTGGVFAGWALVEALRHRTSNPVAMAAEALVGVIVLTLIWELGEFIGDQLLDTTLDPKLRDSALDIAFGTVGGAAGIAVAAVVGVLLRRPTRAGGSDGSGSR